MNLIKRNDNIYPTFVDTRDPKYMLIDNKYVASLFVINYNRETEGGFLDRLISSNISFEMSIFYDKRNSFETLKSLTSYIGNAGSNLKMSSKNQIDIDLMNTSYENAKYIKKQIQVENDDIYFLNIYILTSADSLEELESNLQRIEGIAAGSGLATRRAIFRQELLFKCSLPILYNPNEIKNISKRNVLSSGIISTYPFLSNELCDDTGILIGVNALNNSIVMVDRFDSEKYKNANMCVIGASGSGKSYFLKLMIARNRLLNIEQYIIDPDREYIDICVELGGTYLNFGKENIINVMEIREIILDEDESFLQNKIQKLMAFFSIILPNLSDEEKSNLEEKIIECYKEKGITFDNNSLYSANENGKLLSENLMNLNF